MSSTPRNILVTGAGGGMCRGINARLAGAGHTIVCVDLDAQSSETAAKTIRESGGKAFSFAADVADEASVGNLLADVTATVGPVQALVNAAGILDRKYLADSTAESFKRALDVNLVGPFNLIKASSPPMIEAGWG